MPVWRNPNLEELLGASLDEESLSEAAIDRLVNVGATEGEYIEFKGPMYSASTEPRKEWSSEQEFAKDVCAFANHFGGVIVIGVKEIDEVASECTPITQRDAGGEQQRLRVALVNYVNPPVRTAFITVRSDSRNGYYMLVVVPPSNSAPHAVLARPGESRCLRYPVRDGAGTRWLSEPELAERYRRRFVGREERTARDAMIVEDGWDALQPSGGVWTYLAVIPEYPVNSMLDRHVVDDARDWWSASMLMSPLGRTLEVTRPIPAPYRVTFPGRHYGSNHDNTDPQGTYLELNTMGAAFAAREIRNAAAVPEALLADDLILLADACLKWAARQVGAWGEASVCAGLTDAKSPGGRLSSPIEIRAEQGGIESRIAGTKRVAKSPVTRFSVELSDVGSLQQRLVVAHRALAGVLHWFGIAQPSHIEPDGRVDARAWGTEQVRVWARSQGVER